MKIFDYSSCVNRCLLWATSVHLHLCV